MSALGGIVQLKSIAIEERPVWRLHWSTFSSQRGCVWQLTRSGVNRISHPNWVKLSVELNCAPNQNTKFSFLYIVIWKTILLYLNLLLLLLFLSTFVDFSFYLKIFVRHLPIRTHKHTRWQTQYNSNNTSIFSILHHHHHVALIFWLYRLDFVYPNLISHFFWQIPHLRNDYLILFQSFLFF